MESIRRLSNVMRHGRRNSDKLLEDTIKIDHTCIVKQGYLVKSPPLQRIKNRLARWHMRWFILYDTKPRCEVDPAVDREVELLYYRNNESQHNGDVSLGRINMIGAEVSIHRAGIHGYPFVINVTANNRTYYLCATQFYVFNEWLQKLKKHLPSPSLFLRSVPLCGIGTHTPVNRTNTTGSIRCKECKKCKSLSQAEEAEITANPARSTSNNVSAPVAPCCVKTPPFNAAVSFFEPANATSTYTTTYKISNDRCRDGCTDCEIYDDKEVDDILSNTAPSQLFRQEFQRTAQLHLKPRLSIMPTSLLFSNLTEPDYDNRSLESDEGIARTSSDSSTTSKEPLSSIANSMSSYTTFRSAFDWSEMGAFVGPTLPHSFSTSILKNNDMNNNSNNICSNGNKNPSLKKKIPLSRAKSRSLDSINRIFSDLNVSTIFDQDIDEIFPPLCRYKSEDGDQMFGGGGANDYALQQGVQQEG